MGFTGLGSVEHLFGCSQSRIFQAGCGVRRLCGAAQVSTNLAGPMGWPPCQNATSPPSKGVQPWRATSTLSLGPGQSVWPPSSFSLLGDIAFVLSTAAAEPGCPLVSRCEEGTRPTLGSRETPPGVRLSCTSVSTLRTRGGPNCFHRSRQVFSLVPRRQRPSWW